MKRDDTQTDTHTQWHRHRRHHQLQLQITVIKQFVHLVYATRMTQVDFFRLSRLCWSWCSCCLIHCASIAIPFCPIRCPKPARSTSHDKFLCRTHSCRAALFHNLKTTSATDRFVCQPPDGQRRLYFIVAQHRAYTVHCLIKNYSVQWKWFTKLN